MLLCVVRLTEFRFGSLSWIWHTMFLGSLIFTSLSIHLLSHTFTPVSSTPVGPTTIRRAVGLIEEATMLSSCSTNEPWKLKLCMQCHLKDEEHNFMHSTGANLAPFEISCPKRCFSSPVFTFCKDLLTKDVAKIKIFHYKWLLFSVSCVSKLWNVFFNVVKINFWFNKIVILLRALCFCFLKSFNFSLMCYYLILFFSYLIFFITFTENGEINSNKMK